MALSIVDLYQKILPKTNCKECGYPTCLAFASMVVSEKLPLKNCPYVAPEVLSYAQKELDAQYAAGKWTKKDMAADALKWAKERSASMKIEDLTGRIGGERIQQGDDWVLRLPYFTEYILIQPGNIVKEDGTPLNRWEQVFIYNHIAQGGSVEPKGKWKGLEEFPNTVSKIKSMKSHVEQPLLDRFSGKMKELKNNCLKIGGKDQTAAFGSADLSVLFTPLPKVPVMLMFWEQEPTEKLDAIVKLMFDETITEHLDIESIMFLSERIRQLLCDMK